MIYLNQKLYCMSLQALLALGEAQLASGKAAGALETFSTAIGLDPSRRLTRPQVGKGAGWGVSRRIVSGKGRGEVQGSEWRRERFGVCQLW